MPRIPLRRGSASPEERGRRWDEKGYSEEGGDGRGSRLRRRHSDDDDVDDDDVGLRRAKRRRRTERAEDERRGKGTEKGHAEEIQEEDVEDDWRAGGRWANKRKASERQSKQQEGRPEHEERNGKAAFAEDGRRATSGRHRGDQDKNGSLRGGSEATGHSDRPGWEEELPTPREEPRDDGFGAARGGAKDRGGRSPRRFSSRHEPPPPSQETPDRHPPAAAATGLSVGAPPALPLPPLPPLLHPGSFAGSNLDVAGGDWGVATLGPAPLPPAPEDGSLAAMEAAQRALEEKDKAKEQQQKAQQQQQPSFELSGKLAEETNRVRGITLQFTEPPEAKKPNIRWRLYVFKEGEPLKEPLYIHRQTCYLFGRERKVADIPTDHPSCSKQHAVIQFRLTEKEVDGELRSKVRPYLMDLGSTNGTYLNGARLEPQRYYELLEKDTLKFGNSSREYVLLHENSA